MFANRNTIMNIYNQILTDKKSNKKSFALLIDPKNHDNPQNVKRQMAYQFSSLYALHS